MPIRSTASKARSVIDERAIDERAIDEGPAEERAMRLDR
jgi:hypothetical protein